MQQTIEEYEDWKHCGLAKTKTMLLNSNLFADFEKTLKKWKWCVAKYGDPY